MNKFKAIEITGISLGIGFFSGLLLSVTVHILVVSAMGAPLIMESIVFAHKSHTLLFFIDALPIFGAYTGVLLARRRVSLQEIITKANSERIENSDYIKEVIHNLTIGNLNTKIKEDVSDPEMSDQLKLMQSRLKENLDTQIANRKADQQRSWTSEGLAEFGDLLRSQTSDLENLAYTVISYLVRYMEINQGGFFIVMKKENERFLEMLACHAYDRKKFPGKKINWGEGLIGAVAIERKSYYSNKIPDGYLTITSGLGRANPRYLLIVPLVLNDEVFGVFELASFEEILDYQIQFVERVAENTATSLNIMHSNSRTEQLLRETQEQASKLSIQEEKVRQNMEELKKTQVEAANQAVQFISFTNTVNHTLIRAEYDTEGKLIYANTRFLKKLGYSGNKEVEGKDVSFFIHINDREWFKKIWNRLASGGEHFEGYMRHITKMGLDLWTMSTYTCVRKDDGSIDKILFLSIDSTEQKEKSLYFEGQINAIDKINPKAEFSPDGRLIYFNDLFLKTLKFAEKDIENKNVFDFIANNDQEGFDEIWEQVISGQTFQGQIRMLGKYEEEVWFRATFAVVDDMYGEVDKVVFLAYEITKEKELELSMHDQQAKLKEKEDEMRLQSLDLKKQIDDLKKAKENEKYELQIELKKYLDILDMLPNPIVAINNQGLLLFLNESALKIWKISNKNVKQVGVEQIFSLTQTDPIMQAFVEPGKPIIEIKSKVIKILLSDGRLIEKNISIFKTEAGSELVYTLIVHE